MAHGAPFASEAESDPEDPEPPDPDEPDPDPEDPEPPDPDEPDPDPEDPEPPDPDEPDPDDPDPEFLVPPVEGLEPPPFVVDLLPLGFWVLGVPFGSVLGLFPPAVGAPLSLYAVSSLSKGTELVSSLSANSLVVSDRSGWCVL